MRAYPQITIQSTGPVQVVVAGADALLSLHISPFEGSTVGVVPAELARAALRSKRRARDLSGEFAGRAGQAYAADETLARFAAGARRWASPEEAAWAGEAAADGVTMRQFADLARWRAARGDWAGLPRAWPAGPRAEPKLRGRDRDIRVTLHYDEAVRARRAAREARPGPAERRPTTRPSRGRGRAWRAARDPARGTPEHAAMVAQLDAELGAYMAADGRRAQPPRGEDCEQLLTAL